MSCQTSSPVIYESPTAESLKEIKSFVSGTPYTHIKLSCAILDFNLNVVAFLSKYGICLFEKNGHSIIFNNQSFIAYDENLKIIWEKGPIDIHHLIERSNFSNQILTLSSRYTKSYDFGLIRSDELLVYNQNGEIVKSFNFEPYFRKYPQALEGLPQINGWTKYNQERRTYEVNHGNSFSELYSEREGKRILIGYVYNCIKLRKILIFDTELKKIVKGFSARQPLHTVRQYDENHVIAYENASAVGLYSSVQLISLIDGSYSTLYESKNSTLASTACSSVQVLPDNKLFIVHSKCLKHVALTKDEEGYFLEFVDLKKKKSFAFHVNSGFAELSGELINAEEYLKKSIGQ